MKAAFVILVAVVCVGSANAGTSTQPNASATVAYVAAHTIEGWADSNLTYAQQEQALAEGRTLRVACGFQAVLAIRALLREGIPARPVAGNTLDHSVPLNESGHTLLEAWTNGRWQVFDPTFNEQPVDPQGRGVSINRLSALVRAGVQLKYRPLAHDRLIDFTDFPGSKSDRALTQKLFNEGPEDFYRVVLQQPAVYTDTKGYVYTGSPTAFDGINRGGNVWAWLSASDYATLTASSNAYSESPLSW